VLKFLPIQFLSQLSSLHAFPGLSYAFSVFSSILFVLELKTHQLGQPNQTLAITLVEYLVSLEES